MSFTKTQLKQINRILRELDEKTIGLLWQMRQYARHRAAEDRQKQREGRQEAAKVTAAGRRFLAAGERLLAALAVVDPIGGAKPMDTGELERTRSPASPQSPAGEPSGSMRLVWQRGGEHRDILAADRAVRAAVLDADRAIRRVQGLLEPASGKGGRTSKTTVYRHVIGDLATIYRRRTKRKPTSTNDFADLVTVITGLADPRDEIVAALSRKPRRKS